MKSSNHFDSQGQARIVDITDKNSTTRSATASAAIQMSAKAAESIRRGDASKGDVLAVARLAAIGGAKWTGTLIPLCHNIPIEAVDVDFQWTEDDQPQRSSLLCRVTVQTTYKTGVEMEAMTAASVAALTIYDMLKSVDKAMEVTSVRLESKDGGKSGSFRR